MEDIKVGELVRLKSGRIDKVIYNNCYMQQYIDCEKGLYLRDNITKHSFDLIDLLEVGDYVNGYRVHKITSACIYFTGKAVQNKLTMNIKSILTHQQFEANCYRVKGK